MRVQLLDISRGLSFLHSLEIVHGDLKGVRLSSFHYYTSVGSNFTTSNLRIIFSLTGWVVRDLLTSGSLPSLVSAVRRPLGIGSGDPNDGWPPSSSTLALKENLASPRANQTYSLWGWSLLRWGTSTVEGCLMVLKHPLVLSARCSPDNCRSRITGPRRE